MPPRTAAHSTSEQVPPRHAPEVDENRGGDEGDREPARPCAACDAEGDERQGEHDEVVAEAVAELDPALAEVHEVDEGDPDDRDEPAGRESGPAPAADG